MIALTSDPQMMPRSVIAYVVRYAKRVKDDPDRSIVGVEASEHLDDLLGEGFGFAGHCGHCTYSPQRGSRVFAPAWGDSTYRHAGPANAHGSRGGRTTGW